MRAVLACVLVTLTASPAWAIKPFADAFGSNYVQPGSPLDEKVKTVKCNLCHGQNAAGMDDKKVRNDFGKAVAKHLKKADFTGNPPKLDPKTEAGQKALAEGLEKAVAEKSSSGKAFDELIKAGELPAK